MTSPRIILLVAVRSSCRILSTQLLRGLLLFFYCMTCPWSISDFLTTCLILSIMCLCLSVSCHQYLPTSKFLSSLQWSPKMMVIWMGLLAGGVLLGAWSLYLMIALWQMLVCLVGRWVVRLTPVLVGTLLSVPCGAIWLLFCSIWSARCQCNIDHTHPCCSNMIVVCARCRLCCHRHCCCCCHCHHHCHCHCHCHCRFCCCRRQRQRQRHHHHHCCAIITAIVVTPTAVNTAATATVTTTNVAAATVLAAAVVATAVAVATTATTVTVASAAIAAKLYNGGEEGRSKG